MRRSMVCAALAMGLGVKAASAAFSTTTVDFSDFVFPDWREGVTATSSYQPVVDLAITWNNMAAFGRNTWDGYDHTSLADGGKDIGDPAMGPTPLNTVHTFSMSFDQPVTIPSMWLAIYNGCNDVTLNAYTNVSDSSPALSVSLPYGTFPQSGWIHDVTAYGASWLEVTSLAGTPMTKLEFNVKNVGWDNNNLGLFADDITIAPVPEPGVASLVGIGLLGALARRRRA